MSTAWATVILVGLGTVAIKGAGPLLLGNRPSSPRLQHLFDALVPALLAALVATSTLAEGSRLVIDARLAGVAAATVILAARKPLILAVAGAAVISGTVRLLA